MKRISPWAQREWCSASAAGLVPPSQSDGSQADLSVPENLASAIAFVILFKKEEEKNIQLVGPLGLTPGPDQYGRTSKSVTLSLDDRHALSSTWEGH